MKVKELLKLKWEKKGEWIKMDRKIVKLKEVWN